jgi:hypothetical protein
MFGEVFNTFIFPLNLPGPLFTAVGSLFLLTLLFRILLFIDSLFGLRVFWPLDRFSFLIFPIVFVVVLVVGYIRIFTDLVVPAKREIERTKSAENKKNSDKKTEDVDWEDVKKEFKKTVFDLLSLVRESINKKRKD